MDSTSLFILPENFVGPLKIHEFGVNEYAEQYTESHMNSNPDVFKRTALYVKYHPKSGKLYFGKTIKRNVLKYRGSGRLWGRVIGKDKTIETPFVMWFDDPVVLVQYAMSFSVINDVVCSSSWCNLIPEDGLNGGAIGCSHRKHKITGEIRLFSKTSECSGEWEDWGSCMGLMWWSHDESGKCVRALDCPGEGWINENLNMKGTRMYIDSEDVVHQVLPEIAREYGWKTYSHSEGKRLYSNGKEIHLFEHDKQPDGWTIYDEKFGKRMYTLQNGSRKWFVPGTQPKDSTEYCSTAGCRQYRHTTTNHTIQVPYGTQPDGYVEYSGTFNTIRLVNIAGNLLRVDKEVRVDGYVVLPTYKSGMILHIDVKNNAEFWLDHVSNMNPTYNSTHDIICDGFTQQHADNYII